MWQFFSSLSLGGVSSRLARDQRNDDERPHETGDGFAVGPSDTLRDAFVSPSASEWDFLLALRRVGFGLCGLALILRLVSRRGTWGGRDGSSCAPLPRCTDPRLPFSTSSCLAGDVGNLHGGAKTTSGVRSGTAVIRIRLHRVGFPPDNQ